MIYGRSGRLSEAELRALFEPYLAQASEGQEDLLLPVAVDEYPTVNDFGWNRWARDGSQAALWWWLVATALALAVWPLLYATIGRLWAGGWAFARWLGLVLAGVPGLARSEPRRHAGNTPGGWRRSGSGGSGGRRPWARPAVATGRFAREHWRELLLAEALALAAYLLFVLLRLVNPDLWHPWWGGERPMEMGFLLGSPQEWPFPALRSVLRRRLHQLLLLRPLPRLGADQVEWRPAGGGLQPGAGLHLLRHGGGGRRGAASLAPERRVCAGLGRRRWWRCWAISTAVCCWSGAGPRWAMALSVATCRWSGGCLACSTACGACWRKGRRRRPVRLLGADPRHPGHDQRVPLLQLPVWRPPSPYHRHAGDPAALPVWLYACSGGVRTAVGPDGRGWGCWASSSAPPSLPTRGMRPSAGAGPGGGCPGVGPARRRAVGREFGGAGRRGGRGAALPAIPALLHAASGGIRLIGAAAPSCTSCASGGSSPSSPGGLPGVPCVTAGPAGESRGSWRCRCGTGAACPAC